MPAVTAAWRAALEVARQEPTPAQQAWDREWQRWQDRAIQQGRTPNAAAGIAYTRTEDQYGKRPEEKL